MKYSHRVIAGLLAVLLLAHVVPIMAQEPPGPDPGNSSGRNTIRFKVVREDPENPGNYLPASGVWLSYSHIQAGLESMRISTNDDGLAIIDNAPNGLTMAMLDLDQHYAYLEGYILDEQTSYLMMDHNTTEAELEFVLRLIPESGQPETGGIRLQKAYFPYPITFTQGLTPVMELMVFKGEEVTGAEFIVYSVDGDNQVLRYWNRELGFVDQAEQATPYASDQNDRVLIEGLPVGIYLVREVKSPPGYGKAVGGADLGDDGWGKYLTPFEVMANRIVNKPLPVVNAPEGFNVGFQKLEKDPSYQGEIGTPYPEGAVFAGRPIVGAKFVIYRLANGQKEYLYYRTPFSSEQQMPVAGFTADRNRAHLLVSGYIGDTPASQQELGTASSFFAAMNLPSYLPDSDIAATYYLEEVEAAPGYQINTVPIVFNKNNALDVNEEQTDGIIDIFNQRVENTIIIQKAAFPLDDPYNWAGTRYLAGAEFVLLRAETIVDDQTGDSTGYRASVYRGQGNGEALFSDEIIISFEESASYEGYMNILNRIKDLEPLTVRTAGFSGSAVIEGPLPSGSYMVLETKWPEGYDLFHPAEQDEAFLKELAERYSVHLPYLMSMGEVFEHDGGPLNARVFSYNMPIKNTLFLRKTDQDGLKYLPGAKFIIKVRVDDWSNEIGIKSEGYLAAPPAPGQEPEMVEDPEDAYRFETGEDGQLVISHFLQSKDKVFYSYLPIEVEAPEGYFFDGLEDEDLRFGAFPTYLTVRNHGLFQAPVTVKMKKEMKDGSLPEKDQFTFELVKREDNGAETRIATATNDENGAVLFHNAWVEHRIGEEFSLVVREVIPPLQEQEYIRYDDKECVRRAILELSRKPVPWIMPTFSGEMRKGPQGTPDIMPGIWAILTMIIGELDPPPCSFVNEVLVPDPVEAQVMASKRLLFKKSGAPQAAPLAAGDYSFTLAKENPDSPGEVSVTVTNDVEGKVIFPAMAFEEPGSHRYWLREEVPSGGDIASYDRRVFEVIITVEDQREEDGSLSRIASVSYRDIQQNEPSNTPPTFINTVYEPVQATILLSKRLEGGELEAGQFQFELWQDGALLKDGITHDEKGTVNITTPPVSAPGLYTYQVKEAAGNEEGYTYDTDTLYTVQVTIAEGADGALGLQETKLFKNGRSYTGGLVFNNRYVSPTPTPTATTFPSPSPTDSTPPKPSDPPVVPSYPTLKVPLDAKKVLQGGSLKAGMFTFQLKDAGGKVLAEASNDASGRIVFPDRTFSREVSNYRYTINEIAGADGKMIYDKTVYTVKISTRAVNGRLEAAVDIEKNGTPFAGNMVFTNRRQAPPTGDSGIRIIALLLATATMLLTGAWLLRKHHQRA